MHRHEEVQDNVPAFHKYEMEIGFEADSYTGSVIVAIICDGAPVNAISAITDDPDLLMDALDGALGDKRNRMVLRPSKSSTEDALPYVLVLRNAAGDSVTLTDSDGFDELVSVAVLGEVEMTKEEMEDAIAGLEEDDGEE